MDRFRNKLIRFMYGRNGPDELYKFCVYITVGLIIVNVFLRSVVVSLLIWAVLIYSVFRCVSKKVDARREENSRYLQAVYKVRKRLSMRKTMLTDKQHYYRKCPQCKNVLRLPRVSGNHTAKCPKCGKEMAVKIR